MQRWSRLIHEGGSWAEIYSLKIKKPVRLPAVRNVLKQVEEYRKLLSQSVGSNQKTGFCINQLEKAEIFHSYPVLIESAGGLVAQAEHTIVITQDGCEVTQNEQRIEQSENLRQKQEKSCSYRNPAINSFPNAGFKFQHLRFDKNGYSIQSSRLWFCAFKEI